MRMTDDIATCMYHTGIDPYTEGEVHVAKGLRDRKVQRALMQFFKPENYFTCPKLKETGHAPKSLGLADAHSPRAIRNARKDKVLHLM